MSKFLRICQCVAVLFLLLFVQSCSSFRVPRDLAVSPRQHRSSILVRENYVECFSKRTLCPVWVSWQLTKNEARDKSVTRSNEFSEDKSVRRKYRLDRKSYRGENGASVYDRGHMAPSGDMQFSAKAMKECFYMTNMCPQNKILNQEYWRTLEEKCRKWAVTEGEIYIVCGPIYKSKKYKRIGSNPHSSKKKNRVAVPDAFFKVVLSLRKGHEKAIGFIYENNSSKQSMNSCAFSVDNVESVTGLDFFPFLSKKKQKQLESSFSLNSWN